MAEGIKYRWSSTELQTEPIIDDFNDEICVSLETGMSRSPIFHVVSHEVELTRTQAIALRDRLDFLLRASEGGPVDGIECQGGWA